MGHYHAMIWIDHLEARVFHFNADEVETLVIHPDKPHRHIHHKTHVVGSGNAPEDQAFFHAAAEAVSDAGALLIAGPATAKTELVKHINRHHPRLVERIAGVEASDHPSDKELVAHARKYFAAADRMAG